MTDLIQRLTDATGNERGLFAEAADILLPMPFAGKLEELAAWSDMRLRYRAMLDAEAWTRAAEMLVREGCKLHSLVDQDYGHEGKTPALALLIAALKAGGNDAV